MYESANYESNRNQLGSAPFPLSWDDSCVMQSSDVAWIDDHNDSASDVFGLISSGSHFGATLSSVESGLLNTDLDNRSEEFEGPLSIFLTSESDYEAVEVPRTQPIQVESGACSASLASAEAQELSSQPLQSSKCYTRPRLATRKSNPFYLPSKHIRNMIAKERQRKSSRKISIGAEKSWESSEDLNMHPKYEKPGLERRQTVG
ncbi:LADA_0A06260g1_1 [Lachancea dasiensis]|uniref:LADA_0A06260g1_1 n=1 Tax=Lachancea dasiensis TaxID=1072105 RepID=A0A1G4IPD2_9SACH|nr:LADA_0A06260g1_1 [Lachancea dasiensis]